jgi:CRP-like cAMP-binding protein
VTAAELALIPLFAQLSDDERARIADVAETKHFDVGQEIVHEGEFAFNFYAIQSGAAEVRAGGELITVLGVGDVFGEVGSVPHPKMHWTRRRSATVKVTVPINAIAIRGSDLRRLIDQIPALGEGLQSTIAKRTARHAGRG